MLRSASGSLVGGFLGLWAAGPGDNWESKSAEKLAL